MNPMVESKQTNGNTKVEGNKKGESKALLMQKQRAFGWIHDLFCLL
jgi:hypothetical protein